MADNSLLPPATGGTILAAADEVAYSGDTAKVQLVRVVKVSGIEGAKTVLSNTATGSILLATNAVTVPLNGEFAQVSFAIMGTWTGVLTFEASNDDFVNVTTIIAHRAGDNTRTQTLTGTADNDIYRLATASFKAVRLIATSMASGTAVVTAFATENTSTVLMNAPPPDTVASGSLAAAAQTVVMSMNGCSSAAIMIAGTWVGTITFEASLDGTTWAAINAVSASTSMPQTTATVNGLYRLTPGGVQQIRANMTAFTSGSATLLLRASPATGGIFSNQILPIKNTDGVSSQAIKAASTAAVAADQAAVVSLSPNSMLPGLAPTTLWVTATAATGVAATASLPAAGAGLFHYITAIDIQLYATAACTGGATPVIVTSTNLPGSPAFNFPTAQVIGAIDRYDIPLMTPIKSSVANTITTIAAPIATAGLWRINVGYYTGA